MSNRFHALHYNSLLCLSANSNHMKAYLYHINIHSGKTHYVGAYMIVPNDPMHV